MQRVFVYIWNSHFPAMKKFVVFWYACWAASHALAQKDLPDFGEIAIADLRMKSCSFQPEAHAMILFDVQEIKFGLSDYDAKLVTERRVRIKIFDEKGYKSASIHLPYFSKKRVTKIKDLSGAVYNLDSNGNIIVQKLEKKDFFKEKSEDNLDIINFTFSNVKPGSVIEFRYTKIEKDMLQIDPWIIQKEIPTAYAATMLTTPSFSKIIEKINGIDSIPRKTVQASKRGIDQTIRTYFIENIRAFEPEPFMSSYKDNLLKVIFFLIPKSGFLINALTSPQVVWRFTGLNLLGSATFGGQIKKIIPGTENLIDSAKKIPSSAGKIRFLYEAVQKRIPASPEQTLYPDDIVDAWNTKTGNTAEINLILINLLQKADIKSFPLLVSTRDHGKVNMEFPSSGQLNGVDVLAADSEMVYIMDASIKYQSWENPPLNVMNRTALLLNPADIKWIMISDERPLLRQNTDILASIREDGNVEGNALLTYYDYAKSYMLDSTSHDDDDEEDKFIDKKPAGLKIISAKLDSVLDATDPLVQNIEFSYEPQNSDQFYFINPQLLFFRKQNPFIKSFRNTDIDFGCNQKLTLVFQLTFPRGFQVEELPKNIIVRAPDTSFYFTRIFSSDSTHVFLSQIFEVKKPVFYKEDYPAVQEFFTRAYALMGDEIILRKKK
jgi:Domain of Unknown Function with PDB structure (DUF3857)